MRPGQDGVPGTREQRLPGKRGDLSWGRGGIEFPGACQPPAQDHLSTKEPAPSRDTIRGPSHPSVILIRPHLLPGGPPSSALPHSGAVAEADPLSPLLAQPREHPSPPHPHCQPEQAPSAVGRGLQVTCLQPSTLPTAGPNRPRDISPPPLAQTQPLLLDLNHVPLHRNDQATPVVSPRPLPPPHPPSSCPRAPGEADTFCHCLSPSPKSSHCPTPQPGSYPTCSQHKCNQGPLAAALHLICICPHDC